jgi:hypothetical protein
MQETSLPASGAETPRSVASSASGAGAGGVLASAAGRALLQQRLEGGLMPAHERLTWERALRHHSMRTQQVGGGVGVGGGMPMFVGEGAEAPLHTHAAGVCVWGGE